MKRYVYEIYVDSLELLGRKEGGSSQGGAYTQTNESAGSHPTANVNQQAVTSPQQTPSSPFVSDEADDLPF